LRVRVIELWPLRVWRKALRRFLRKAAGNGSRDIDALFVDPSLHDS